MHSPIIYICEDDWTLGQHIQALLHGEGYEASLYYDGESLSAAISSQLPDLLLMDVQLPGEDGLVLAQRYSSSLPGVRIIMMSVRDSDVMRLSGYQAGAMMYLPKPFEPAALLACLQGLFGYRQRPTEAVLHISNAVISVGSLQTNLTQSELVLLRELGLANGDVVEYFKLIEALDLPQDESSKASLEVSVSRLRKKLKSLQRHIDLQLKNKQKTGYFLLGKLSLQDI